MQRAKRCVSNVCAGLGVVLLIRGQIFLSQRAPRCGAAVANDPLKNSS